MKSRFSHALAIVLLGVMTFSLIGNVQTAEAANFCNAASFIADVTIPDGTYINPGAPFTKTWRLKNTGTCAWTPTYALAYFTGERMGNTQPVFLSRWVSPGQSIDVSVTLTAPTASGTYRGYWKLQNTSGVMFGIGGAAANAFWVQIRVLGATQSVVSYDFIQNMCGGLWVFDGGPIACPVNFNKLFLGYVQKIDNPTMENGQLAGAPALLTVPQDKFNGFIQGIFPVDAILKGDHFQATIGCQYGATSCSVRYQLDYGSGTGTNFITLWKFNEQYDGLFYNVDIDLSPVEFVKDPRIVLSVYANGSAQGDFPLWVSPRIVRNVAAPVVTPTPLPPTSVVPTPTPSPVVCADRAQFITDVTVPDGSVFQPNATFNKVWRLKNVGTCTWTTSYALTFISGNNMGAGDTPLSQSVAPGATIDAGINLTAPGAAGSYRGYWELKNASGGVFGIGAAFDHPFWVDIKVSGTPLPTVTPSTTPVPATFTSTPVTSTSTPVTGTPPSSTPTNTPTNTAVPPTSTFTPSPTSTSTSTSISGWSTYQDNKYLFSFQFPPGSTLSSSPNNSPRIYLPIVTLGTNLGEKYVDVSVVEGASTCQSPEASQSIVSSSQNVTINGIQFLKQTGTGAATSNRWDWTGYSTVKGNACISLTFTLHSVVQGVVVPTPPAYDPATESAVFSTIMTTYANR